MIKLSVVIICLNEERNIGRCLSSVEGVADEIVVVDSGSTDNTQNLCEAAGARYYFHPFKGYIEQKNYALAQAKFPYVLSLDADEALSDELKKSILETKDNWEYDGYSMNRLSNYCGSWIKHSGWYPDRKLRLFKSSFGKWGGINPHDEFLFDKKTTVNHLKGDLLHYSYYTREQHLEKIKKFSDIAAKSLFLNGDKPTVFKLFFHPLARFIKSYILKLGILDGTNGFFISRTSAYANYLKYSKLRSLYKNK